MEKQKKERSFSTPVSKNEKSFLQKSFESLSMLSKSRESLKISIPSPEPMEKLLKEKSRENLTPKSLSSAFDVSESHSLGLNDSQKHIPNPIWTNDDGPEWTVESDSPLTIEDLKSHLVLLAKENFIMSGYVRELELGYNEKVAMLENDLQELQEEHLIYRIRTREMEQRLNELNVKRLSYQQRMREMEQENMEMREKLFMVGNVIKKIQENDYELQKEKERKRSSSFEAVSREVSTRQRSREASLKPAIKEHSESNIHSRRQSVKKDVRFSELMDNRKTLIQQLDSEPPAIVPSEKQAKLLLLKKLEKEIQQMRREKINEQAKMLEINAKCGRIVLQSKEILHL